MKSNFLESKVFLKLVQLYTGFKSYEHLLLFYEFLGPSVNHLNYWGKKKTTTSRKRKMKLSPLNQLFLTLIKLKLKLRERDIAYHIDLNGLQVFYYMGMLFVLSVVGDRLETIT